MRNVVLLSLVVFALPALAQEQPSFNDIEAADKLQDISSLLSIEEIDATALNNSRAQIRAIAIAASACADENSITRARLQERLEPLKDLAPEGASADSLVQRQSIANALDEATARQARCEGLLDDSQALSLRITNLQNQLSQQFLSARTSSVIAIARALPASVGQWAERLRQHLDLPLKQGILHTTLLWYLIIAGLGAALVGFVIRNRFCKWYEAAGGDEAPPQMKYLFPKPLAEFAPLWLEGAALLVVLTLAMEGIASEQLAVRLAVAIFAFGLSCVVIYWATGPLSPSAGVKGLIPDHVAPLRLRLRLVVLALVTSYVVLGNSWLSASINQPFVTGRAAMLITIACALLYLISYLGRIPGLQGRYRALRFVTHVLIIFALIAALTGYHNLSGYLMQGITRTGLALFLLWVVLWLVYVGFNYLLEEKTQTAIQVRNSLGITGKGSGTGIGFMQLVADLFIWVAVIAYLIDVWDNTGSTLGKLRLAVVEGWDFGGVSLVPKNIIGGILLFTALVVVIGWVKRWMERRWLKRIVLERGARDAILTLFGYVAFILAIVISLKAASVDLTGLAIVSGALALGLGFGLQGIANNFVSGLILLFERPIRAGDFVSIGDVEGYVRVIRIRATEIETLDNQKHGRLQVRVGVAYGSNTEKVREILETIGREHPDVISDGRAPAPSALFMGFGDSSLNFELRVRVQRIERRFSVMSDMNFAIDKAFREAGISIPFPQRDLHIVSYPEQQTPVTSAAMPKTDHNTSGDEITRSHNAQLDTVCDRSEVWTAITDIEVLKRWLVSDGTFVPQIGGAVNIVSRDGYPYNGRIDTFVPNRRLRIVLAQNKDEGPLSTGPITVTLVLSERKNLRHLSVTISGIPASEDWEEFYRLSVDRWDSALAELNSDVLGK